jgi:hypothetical protein
MRAAGGDGDRFRRVRIKHHEETTNTAILPLRRVTGGTATKKPFRRGIRSGWEFPKGEDTILPHLRVICDTKNTKPLSTGAARRGSLSGKEWW